MKTRSKQTMKSEKTPTAKNITVNTKIRQLSGGFTVLEFGPVKLTRSGSISLDIAIGPIRNGSRGVCFVARLPEEGLIVTG